MSEQLIFLDELQLRKLTGRCYKSKQIEWLRQNGVPFRISATGHPVVTVAAIEGRQPAANDAKAHEPPRWTPRAIGR